MGRCGLESDSADQPGHRDSIRLPDPEPQHKEDTHHATMYCTLMHNGQGGRLGREMGYM